MSPALQGRFLTPGPPGNSLLERFYKATSTSFSTWSWHQLLVFSHANWDFLCSSHLKWFWIISWTFKKNYLFILLYNVVLVLPYIDLNLPWMYLCSPSWTPLPPPSPSHPSGSSQCTSPEHPVSCIEPGLVIHFTWDNLHVSMTFSQIIQPSPSPTESKRLFNTSVSLLLSRIQGYYYHLSKFHIYALVYCIGIFLSDLLHSVK